MANNISSLEDLFNDPEFWKLPIEDQEQLVDELNQATLGKIPNTENILQRAMRGITESSPGALQFAGGVTGSVLGATRGIPIRGGVIGGTAGRGIGELIKQGGRALRGEEFDFKQVIPETGTAAATESGFGALTLGAGKFFPAAANKTFVKPITDKMGNMLRTLKAQGKKISSNELVKALDQAFDSLKGIPVRDPGKKRGIRMHISQIKETIKEAGDELDAGFLFKARLALDDTLSRLKIFVKKGSTQGLKKKIDVDVEDAVVKLRDVYDSRIRGIAREIDPKLEKEFVSNKEAFSKIAKAFPKDESGIGGLIPPIVKAGGILDVITGGVPTGVGKLIAGEILESPKTAPAIFKTVKNVSRIGPTAASEIVSRLRPREET